MDMQITFPGGKKVTAGYKGFTVSTDQPVEQGGEGTALSPFDLFFASIGTCAGFYVLRFCQERDIPTEDIKLTLTTKKNEDSKMIDQVVVEIILPPGFPNKYRKAVVAAAESCTVKKHIINPPQFNIITS